MSKTMDKNAKFWIAERDTRWDVYPQKQPTEVIAHDWHGFWAWAPGGFWFKTPTSYNFAREITRAEADALLTTCVEDSYHRMVLPQ